MGSIAFALLLLLAAPINSPVAAGIFMLPLVGAGLLAVWVARRTASVRAAWGDGCFVNGLLSTAVALSFRVQDEPWSGRLQYPDDLDRAIGSLTHFVWALAARVGLATLVLAAVLFALSYWLLGPPHGKA
jgi:hypothetical protein